MKRKPGPKPQSSLDHGKANTYGYWGCRCVACTRANTARSRMSKSKIRESSAPAPESVHGTLNGYSYWGCRCSPCVESVRAYKDSIMTPPDDMPLPPRPDRCQCCSSASGELLRDHDHISGYFRGWLCASCNSGIGKLGDGIDGLKRALEYLEKNG